MKPTEFIYLNNNAAYWIEFIYLNNSVQVWISYRNTESAI